MNVNDILANPRDALGLATDEIPVNIIMLAEYVTLDPDTHSPERRRLAMVASDELEPWTSIGMLRFAQLRENGAVRDAWDDPDDEE